MRKTTIAVLTALMMVTATVALAKEPPDGPPEGKGPEAALEKNDDTWYCEDDGFVANHCLNVRSAGKTWNIRVFDSRGPQESGSTDEAADGRPCPQDGDADPDGTWWEYTDDVEGDGSNISLYVCHHSGQQPDS